jgi:hypothetical protein
MPISPGNDTAAACNIIFVRNSSYESNSCLGLCVAKPQGRNARSKFTELVPKLLSSTSR